VERGNRGGGVVGVFVEKTEGEGLGLGTFWIAHVDATGGLGGEGLWFGISSKRKFVRVPKI